MRRIVLLFVCSCVCCLLPLQAVPVLLDAPLPSAYASGSTGPRFNWSSFLFFWNKNAPVQVKLTNPQPVPAGYYVDFGHTVSVTVLVKQGGVRGVHVRYVGGRGYDAGGPKFTRLVQHAIGVGSFRWPDDVIQEAREHFRTMTKITKDFRYQNTLFRMEHNDDTGWLFTMMYLS